MTKQGFEPKVRWEHLSLFLKETESSLKEVEFFLSKQSPEFYDKAGSLYQYGIKNQAKMDLSTIR